MPSDRKRGEGAGPPAGSAPAEPPADGAARLRELERRLGALRARMEDGLPGRARELRDAAASLTGDPTARDAIRRAAHKLRGIAASHGHEALGEEAAELEARATDPASADLELRAATLALARSIEQASAAASARPVRDAASPATLAAPRPSQTPLPPRPPPKRLAGLSILVLDDDEATRRLVELTFGPIGGAAVRVVATREALFEALRAAPADLVIVDAVMPEASGLEVIRALRVEHAERGLRFAVLSAATAAELDWPLDASGGVAWLRKPFRPLQLVAQVAAVLGR